MNGDPVRMRLPNPRQLAVPGAFRTSFSSTEALGKTRVSGSETRHSRGTVAMVVADVARWEYHICCGLGMTFRTFQSLVTSPKTVLDNVCPGMLAQPDDCDPH